MLKRIYQLLTFSFLFLFFILFPTNSYGNDVGKTEFSSIVTITGGNYSKIEITLRDNINQIAFKSAAANSEKKHTFNFDKIYRITHTVTATTYDAAGKSNGTATRTFSPTATEVQTQQNLVINIPASTTTTTPKPDPAVTNTCEDTDNKGDFKCFAATCGDTTSPFTEKTDNTGVYSCSGSTIGSNCCKDPVKYAQRKGSSVDPQVPPGSSNVTPPTSTPTLIPLPTNNDVCATRGGLKGGVSPVQLCNGKPFNADDAKKPQDGSHPYCGRVYQIEYECSDGNKEKVTPTDQTICNSDPWCPQTTPSGTGDICAGAANVASNGKCPAATPLCNKPTGVTPECVAAASKTNSQFCSKKEVCNSGYCKAGASGAPSTCDNDPVGTVPACTAKICAVDTDCDASCNDTGKNDYKCENTVCKFVGTGATPTPVPATKTPTPTAVAPAGDFCPVVDTDGQPNSCWYSDTEGPAGYKLKSPVSSHPANASCANHTSGKNPWCWHKDPSITAATPTTAPEGTLDPTCPNIDTDGKPNSCEDVGYCPPGYSTSKKSSTAHDACTKFRGKDSQCCHQN